MTVDQLQTAWEVITASVQGFSHLRSETPNQDAISKEISSDHTLPVIIAVADGHGSPKSTRSDIGSRLAVQEAIAVASQFLREMQAASPSQVKECVDLRKLQARICDRWTQQVRLHFAENRPQAEPGVKHATESAQPSEVKVPQDVPLSMYGSTILLAILSHNYLICLQIGDGDILAVFDTLDQSGKTVLTVED